MRLVNTCLLLVCLLTSIPVAAQRPAASQRSTTPVFKVDYEKFTLNNGLQVIFHVDRSDPVVAVALTAHVGSAREKEGRTGFSHLFEHLLFLESEDARRKRPRMKADKHGSEPLTHEEDDMNVYKRLT